MFKRVDVACDLISVKIISNWELRFSFSFQIKVSLMIDPSENCFFLSFAKLVVKNFPLKTKNHKLETYFGTFCAAHSLPRAVLFSMQIRFF